jgi:CRP/FNR family transcriptional regulator
MSMIASFGSKISKVSATTEIMTEVATVSNEKIREWQIQYPEWNNLILDLFVNRYNDMINTIEELSFKKIEDRLKTYLNKYLNKSGKIVVSKTHLQISKDLGTSREVVSRALKKIESEMNYEFHLKK